MGCESPFWFFLIATVHPRFLAKKFGKVLKEAQKSALQRKGEFPPLANSLLHLDHFSTATLHLFLLTARSLTPFCQSFLHTLWSPIACNSFSFLTPFPGVLRFGSGIAFGDRSSVPGGPLCSQTSPGLRTGWMLQWPQHSFYFGCSYLPHSVFFCICFYPVVLLNGAFKWHPVVIHHSSHSNIFPNFSIFETWLDIIFPPKPGGTVVIQQ